MNPYDLRHRARPDTAGPVASHPRDILSEPLASEQRDGEPGERRASDVRWLEDVGVGIAEAVQPAAAQARAPGAVDVPRVHGDQDAVARSQAELARWGAIVKASGAKLD